MIEFMEYENSSHDWSPACMASPIQKKASQHVERWTHCRFAAIFVTTACVGDTTGWSFVVAPKCLQVTLYINSATW